MWKTLLILFIGLSGCSNIHFNSVSLFKNPHASSNKPFDWRDYGPLLMWEIDLERLQLPPKLDGDAAKINHDNNIWANEPLPKF